MRDPSSRSRQTGHATFWWAALRPWLIGLAVAFPVMLLVGLVGPQWLSDQAVGDVAVALGTPLILITHARVTRQSRAPWGLTALVYAVMVAVFLAVQWLLRELR